MADDRTIADRLVDGRQAAGLSQAELAEQAHTHRNTVSRLERGPLKAHPPNLRTWCELLVELDLPVGETTEAACAELGITKKPVGC